VRVRQLLHDMLLDAACELMGERSWAEIPLGDVARLAGVARRTLYQEFGSRERFGQALVTRESDRLCGAVERAVAENRAIPAEALGAAFDVFLSAVSESAVVAAVLVDEADELLAAVAVERTPLLASATARLGRIMQEAWPALAPAEAGLLSEALVRLAISYARLPMGASTMTGGSVAALLAPYLEQQLGGWDSNPQPLG